MRAFHSTVITVRLYGDWNAAPALRHCGSLHGHSLVARLLRLLLVSLLPVACFGVSQVADELGVALSTHQPCNRGSQQQRTVWSGLLPVCLQCADPFERDVLLSLWPVDAILVRLLVLILSGVVLLLRHRCVREARRGDSRRVEEEGSKQRGRSSSIADVTTRRRVEVRALVADV